MLEIFAKCFHVKNVLTFVCVLCHQLMQSCFPEYSISLTISMTDHFKSPWEEIRKYKTVFIKNVSNQGGSRDLDVHKGGWVRNSDNFGQGGEGWSKISSFWWTSFMDVPYMQVTSTTSMGQRKHLT